MAWAGVGHVVNCWGVFLLQLLRFDEVPDEMLPCLDVLGPLVRDWIVGQGDCSFIVTRDKSGFVTISEQEMKTSGPCMIMASCAAKATYSASQELDAI